MCGILAIIDKNCNEENIIRSNRVLKNRGPDSGNIIFEKGVRMLFRRLAIMDVNSTANQPFVNQKSKLICNGEIYNYKKLCETYNIQCKTNSDCEVIIHLADKIGFPDTVLELDGVFATVYYTKTRVYFARDYVGVRPLFYGKTNTGGVAFGSTAMSLQNFCSEIVELEPGWGYYDTQTRILYHEPYKYENLKDKKTSICCCAYCESQYNVGGHFVGIPAVLGRNGVEKIVELDLSDSEKTEFQKSLDHVKQLTEKVDNLL